MSPQGIPEIMKAMVLTGHGDVGKLMYREDMPTPAPKAGEVLVKVTATAKNNTDRKAREGLYPTKDKADLNWAGAVREAATRNSMDSTDVVSYWAGFWEQVWECHLPQTLE